MSIYGPAEPQTCSVLILFRAPLLVAFCALYELRNTMNSKVFGDFREALWFPFWLIFGPTLSGFRMAETGPIPAGQDLN